MVHMLGEEGRAGLENDTQEEKPVKALERYLCIRCVVCPFIGQQDHRTDLSHPIHADNCLLDPEANECWKEPPAYTYRDYRYRCRHISHKGR